MILDFGDEYKSHFFDAKGTDRNVSNFLILDEKQVGIIDSGEVRTSCWRTSSAGPELEVPTAAVPGSRVEDNVFRLNPLISLPHSQDGTVTSRSLQS